MALCLMAVIFWPNAMQAGDLQSVKITPKDSTAGVGTTYVLSFQPETELPNDGKIFIHFPTGFDISGVLVASNSNLPNNLDGGYFVNTDLDGGNRIVILRRDGTGLPLPGNFIATGTVKFSIVGNPSTAGDYGSFTIVTQDGDGNPLDQRDFGISVKIKAGTLDHFIFSPNIANQTAGQNFNFTLLGKDVLNNNVVVNDSVIFSDLTGTLTPKRLKMNGSSLSVNAKITKAQNGVLMTAVAKTLLKTGLSNSFNVVPGSLAQFALSNVPGPLTAGAPFTLSMVAQDASGNTVTSFSGSVNFTPAGKISPLASGSFTNGIRNETIAYLESGINKIITVTDGQGHTGVSNSFTVDPARPSGVITLTTNRKAIPADRNTTASINSTGPIQDAQGNNVGGGKFFTVSVNDTAFGTITTADADLNTPGKQIATSGLAGSLGRLSFTFKAGGKGGAASIFVSSVDGTAAGSIGISVNQVRILAITTLPVTVSQGQQNIPITMRVQNFGADTVSIENANLSFSANVSDYTVTPPSPFPSIPGNGGTRALNFSVTLAPNAQGGAVTINGQLSGKLSSGLTYNVTNADTTDGWTVQTPAKLSVALQASQPTVTQGQTQPWKVTMTVKNDGESTVEVILSDDSTRTSLASDGHQILPPSGPVIVSGKSAQTLDFIVTETTASDTKLGARTVHGQVYARELNSGSLYFASTVQGDSAQIIVQKQASVNIDAVALSEVYNRDNGAVWVNTDQLFQVRVDVKQTIPNAEKVDSVFVNLKAERNALIIKPDTLRLTNLNQSAQSVFFLVKAGKIAQRDAQFYPSIVKAYSANTRENTVKIGANLTKATAKVQKPSALRIDSLTTSLKSVRFGRTQPPWLVYLFVANTANSDSGGVVVIDSAKVTVVIAGAVQNDYGMTILKMPTALRAGEKDTLKYMVAQTGYTGGDAVLSVRLYAHDKNNHAPAQPTASTNFMVVSSALVKILRTDFPPVVNRLSGSDIALVDTSQNFQIEVTVENTGLEVIDTAYVALQNSGSSTLITPQAQALSIVTNGGTAKAVFSVRAANQVAANGETFVARLIRAVTKNGTKALIGPGGDTTAVARIELPARLQLSVVTSDGATSFSRNQQFKVRARIKNLGQAQTDRGGVLNITRPSGYILVNNDPTKNFAAGDSIEWNLRTPSQESLQQNIKVEITQRPKDKNSGDFADTVNTVAQLTVRTLDNALSITNKSIAAPEGATDRILSTDQIFTARTKISASANLTNRTVTLTLPAGSGFRFVNGDSARKSAVGDSVRWQVQAPSIENLNVVKLPIKASAFSNQTEVTALDTLFILGTQKQSILQLEPSIKATGSQNDTVAINQNFTLVAKLRNTGRALVSGSAKVKITLPPNLAALEQPFTSEKSVDFDQQNTIRELTWQVRAAGQPASLNQVTFEITQRPRDVNTGADVLTSNDPALFNVAIVASGTVAASRPFIAAPDGARDFTLSTGQEFTVSDTLRWNNAATLVAELVLSPNQNFTISNRVQNIPNPKTSDEVEVSWIVRAPAAPVANVDCRVLVKATDSHNTALALEATSAAQSFDVVQRAELALSAAIAEPASATSGVVSVGQPFRVVATIINGGTAGVEDSAKVLLTLPPGAGYSLVDSQDRLLKAVRINEQNTVSWWVRARADVSDLADLLKFNLRQPPRDVNTNAFAAVSDGETELAMRAEGRTMIIENLNQGGGPAVQGGQNFLLARLKLTNPARTGSSDLMLKQLSFDLLNRTGTALVPNAVFKAVRVVWRTTTCGERNTTSDVTNPVTVDLTTAVSVAPDKPDTIAIYADLADNMADQNFRLVFDNGQDFSVDDQAGGYGVTVETPEGKRLEKFRLETTLAALHGADAVSSFFNYPNPLQPGNDLSAGQGTRFNLPEGAAGELKIFTLLGELVWEVNVAAGDQGVFWNGQNGVGQRVLNGVYVAVLKPKNGKMLTTKVAVLRK